MPAREMAETERIAEAGAEPQILVALGDRWASTALCAELRERGQMADRAEHLAATLLRPTADGLAMRAVFASLEGLSRIDTRALWWFRMLGNGLAVALLIAADAPVPRGPWDRVLRRPITIGAAADAIAELARIPTTRSRDHLHAHGIDVRLGPPWPFALCAACGRSRHCELPRNATEREHARTILVHFALEHEPQEVA